MSLSFVIEQIKKSLGRTDRGYAEGRARHFALRPYESPADVLAAVDRGSQVNVANRDAVLLAILDEVKASPREVWQSILVVAFAPMIVRFRSVSASRAATTSTNAFFSRSSRPCDRSRTARTSSGTCASAWGSVSAPSATASSAAVWTSLSSTTTRTSPTSSAPTRT
jgi:hypothetical protein